MDAKKLNFVKNLLRSGTFKWKPRSIAKNKGRVQILTECKSRKGIISKRMIWFYSCATCPPEKLYREKSIKMDHIEPVVDPLVGYKDLETYADRMFCGEENFQRLCQDCHDKKTATESGVRAKSRKSKKKEK